jgi:hypothetical protein
MNHSDPTTFGYYTVGNNRMFSKFEALELSDRLNQPAQFHFNDDVFSSCDWKNEPALSLADLYIARARQIRLKYDYVIIFYSGGADSHNMLESFVNSGVEPDEIVSFHSYAADKNRASAFNREVFETAVPYVKNLKKQKRLSAHVPHRLLDMSDIIYRFNNEINWYEFEYYVNCSVSINNVARARLREYVDDWKKIIDSGKKLCLVWGYDKPRVNQVHSKFCLDFMDLHDNCVSVINQQFVKAGYYDEMFYHTPDLPEITIKQAHVVKNFLQTVNSAHPYMTREISGYGHIMKKVNEKNEPHWLTQNGLSYLIYPWFNDQLYYESKPKDIITSKRDRWFWSDPVLSKNFISSIDSIVKRFGNRWANFTSDHRWVQSIRSKSYVIG